MAHVAVGRTSCDSHGLGPRPTRRDCIELSATALDALYRGLSVWLAATCDVHPARDAMAGDDRLQAGVLGHAALDVVRTARLERVARRRIDQIGRQAFDRDEFFFARLVQTWDRLQQAQRVRVARVVEDLVGGAGLD